MYEYCTVPYLNYSYSYRIIQKKFSVRHACEYRYSYSYVHHAGKLFAICNALQFDNLGQMSDKTKQFAKDDKFCQPGGPLDTSTELVRHHASRECGDLWRCMPSS